MKLNSLKKIYFIGIGGIGMSALARYFNERNIIIYGYDLVETKLTKTLEAEGMIIHYDANLKYVESDADLVIYTPAVPSNHVELSYYMTNDFVCKKRAEVLGLISKEGKCIAVAGTHGKTTTSSILGHILNYKENTVSCFLGGILAEQKTNYLSGTSDWVLVEADEYDRSFLQLIPDILVILSMDADHLDIYGDAESMRDAYQQLCSQIKSGGTLIVSESAFRHMDYNWIQALSDNEVTLLRLHRDMHFDNIRIENRKYVFDYFDSSGEQMSLVSVLPGLHNLSNVTIATKVALELDVEGNVLQSALKNFKGIKRRFEIVYNSDVVLIDDYAHHPVEVDFTVKTAKRLYASQNILGIFQPHLYSRTNDFYREFAVALESLDEIWILPIYPAREEPMEGVKSELIYNLVRNKNKQIVQSKELISKINKRQNNEVILTIGASDLNKYHEQIIHVI